MNTMGIKYAQSKKTRMMEKFKNQQMRRETQMKLNKSRSVTRGRDEVNFVEL